MTHRPHTARSEISSNLSDDGIAQLPSSALRQIPPIPSPPLVTQHGYAHLRGVTQPTNRSLRSPALTTTTAGTSSRPQSPMSQISRTHAPSITAQGFLRPLSSRKLQAQRLGRTDADYYVPPPATAASVEDVGSVSSSRQGPYASLPRSHRATGSVHTTHSGSEVPESYDTGSRGGYTQDVDISYKYYNTASPKRKAQPPGALNLEPTLRVGSIRNDLQSPRSFRSTLSFGSKHVFEPGHQQLSSKPNTPMPDEKYSLPVSKGNFGKNHEYFEGNTVFWWGGRLQNARDRPINVATGVLIILPTVLFFVFS